MSNSSAPTLKMPCRKAHWVRMEWSGQSVNRAAGGRRITERPLLCVKFTSASADDAKNEVNLVDRNNEAEPPMPIALTVFETVQ